MLSRFAFAAAGLSMVLSAFSPAMARAAVPLVTAEQRDNVRPPVVEVKKKKGGDEVEGGQKKWFAFWFEDELKPEIEDKKWLLLIVGFLFQRLGANLWGPVLFLHADFDMEWALPSVVYLILNWVIVIPYIFVWVPWIGWALGILLFGCSIAIAWIDTMTMLANMNRPEIQLGGGDDAPRKKKKKHSSDDDE